MRVGVAMITSAPDALSLHENAIIDRCGRALKGHAAVNCVRHLLEMAENYSTLAISEILAVLDPRTSPAISPQPP